MPLQNQTHPALPQTFPNDEARLASLRQALAEGDASPDVEGDIFAKVAEELGLNLNEDEDSIQ